jgi:hypothetical protein
MKTNDWALFGADGTGDPRPITGLRPGGSSHRLRRRGRGLNFSSGDLKLRIERLDFASGKRAFLRDVTPAGPTGVARLSTLQLTPDGRAYCYSFMRSLSRLYMVDGLRSAEESPGSS